MSLSANVGDKLKHLNEGWFLQKC